MFNTAREEFESPGGANSSATTDKLLAELLQLCRGFPRIDLPREGAGFPEGHHPVCLRSLTL